MTDPELRAILVRAAVVEAARQAAKERGDVPAQYEHERELSRLWQRYGELERAA